MKIYLREVRNKTNITLRELEKKSGISRAQIAKIENGDSVPKITTLCSLAKALGVSITDLFKCD